LMNEGMEHISFVVNRMNVKMMEKGISVPLQEAKQWLAIDFLGYVFDDETMIRANNFGKPVTLQRDTSLYSCFQAIVKRMIGERATLPKIKERSFLAKIFG
ncbi:MAG: septum site-determining protein MinD, partial [Longicatena sp.]